MFVEICVGYLAAKALAEDVKTSPVVQRLIAGIVQGVELAAEAGKEAVAETAKVENKAGGQHVQIYISTVEESQTPRN